MCVVSVFNYQFVNQNILVKDIVHAQTIVWLNDQ